MRGLLKCPFCGERQDIVIVVTGSSACKYAVMCDQCGARASRMPTRKEAAQAWNSREGED